VSLFLSMIPCLPEPNLRVPTSLSGEVPAGLGYVLVPGPRGALECRLSFPGDTVPRQVSIDTKKRLEVLLKQSFLEPVDRRILMRLYTMTSRDQVGLQVSGEGGYQVIREMLECGRCRLEGAGGDGLRWCEEAIPIRPGWELVAGERLQPVWQALREGVVIGSAPLVVLDREGRFVAPGECSMPVGVALAWLRGGAMEPWDAVEFHRKLGRGLSEGEIPAPPGIETCGLEGVRPGFVLDLQPVTLLELNEAVGRPLPVARLRFDYCGQWIEAGAPGEVLRLVENNGVMEIPRCVEEEAMARAELERRGLVGVSLGGGAVGWAPEGGAGAWHGFLLEHQGALEAAGWRIRFDGDRRLRVVPEEARRVELRPVESGEGYELEIGVELSGSRVSLLRWLHQRMREVRVRNPEVIRRALEETFQGINAVPGETWLFAGRQFVGIVERVFELHDPNPFGGGERIGLSALRAAEVMDAFAMDPGVEPSISGSVRGLAAVLRDGVKVEDCGSVPGLQASLRDYQRFGVGWLRAMADRDLNGILADDMGLGKTLQTIAHLQWEKAAGQLTKPVLLVVPTSLMGNWRNEVAKFAPGLTVLTLHGEGRAMGFRAMEAADLVITTYGLVQRDEVWHREREYSWVILDEAQFIKNPTSKITKVLARIRCGKRLCLTGTPVENHLGELWALFEFLMPGYLGDRETFKRRFRQPIEQENSAVMREILARRVRPFLLRRTKKEVATELPPKTVVLRPVEMTRRQREVYDHVRAAMQLKVRAEIAEKGLARSKFVILEALTKLRQVCCDPRLARMGEEGLKAVHSAKLAELMSLLPDLIRDDHRVLIFSQFTSMLALIEEELRAVRIGFVTLTGSTVDRERPVADFQSGKVPVFLISLRAGGTGLNLTEADTVIHYDPWWNPQIENQATDRAYRIGQQRPVFVHKMIAAESVEEKIVAMQERKAELAAGILGGSGEGEMAFSEEDVESLFEPGGPATSI
jgi:hypothetical protein